MHGEVVSFSLPIFFVLNRLLAVIESVFIVPPPECWKPLLVSVFSVCVLWFSVGVLLVSQDLTLSCMLINCHRLCLIKWQLIFCSD